MRVKRLELQGFKSFKDKTVLHFDAGITGIVGPNGCGKSNIVDAFFWSMGEQNARHLRGQAMEDLIFSGSDRQPAAAYAEVSLVLEMAADLSGPNAASGASVKDVIAEGSLPTREAMITRKLYRSGESEYFINKTPCRLKDIQELFMDTGVGSRGYSIIQQGQIAKIVQAKPEERRTMIEEVAGIVKYKARRKEAARKLEHTQTNLVRLNDLIGIRETQKKQLERQVEKARKHRDWKEKLQSIELRFNALKWEDLTQKLTLLEQEVNELQTQDAALSGERQTLENIILNKRIEATTAQKITEENQNKWMNFGTELGNSESELKFVQKTLEDLANSLVNLREESAREESQLTLIREENDQLVLENQMLGEALTNALSTRECSEIELNEAKQIQSKSSHEVQDLKKQENQASAALSEAESRANYAASRLGELAQDIARLEGDKSEREIFLEQSRSQKDQASTSLASARSSVEELRQRLSQQQEQLRTTQTTLEQDRRDLARLSAEEVTTRSKLNSLEEHKRRHDQSSLGVQSIFQKILPADSRLKGAVAGTLADALSVESGFETAVETALGRHLDLVLTQDYTIHAEISDALRKAGLGRAALADLGSIKNPSQQNELTEDSRVIGKLSKFIKLSEQAEANGTRLLLEELACNIYVAENSENARQLAAQHPSHVFVSCEGELFKGTWYTEGGDKSQVSGAYVGRNREIADLEASLAQLTSSIAIAKEALQTKEQNLALLEGQKRAVEDQLATAQETATAAAGEEASIAAQYREAEKSLHSLLQDLTRITGEKSKLSAEEDAANTRAQQLREEQTKRSELIAAAELSLETANRELEEKQQQLLDAKVKEASLQEQCTAAKNKLARSESELRERSTRQTYLLEQIEKKTAETERNNSREQELHVTIEDLKHKYAAAEEEFRASKDKLDMINAEIEAERSRSQEISTRENEIKNGLVEKRVDFERATGERNHLIQNTFDYYGITLAEYAASPETIEQVQLLRQAGEETVNEINNEVTLLREKIRKLGEVNTSAIEEYDQVATEYNFLVTQKTDLEKSMADLTSTIERINTVSKERFDRAFHQVNENFKRVFPVIFGGGHASLTMTNPEDFVETGVDIMAQPPGKKPQNINLLSGGEKTLTAISLLFAIFLVKPSPFCLLDEVDAPLDDANIGRFNALLREMAKRSQFIIITHNKRTMELNDKLYGVTMEDAGVSKMVSIQLAANA